MPTKKSSEKPHWLIRVTSALVVSRYEIAAISHDEERVVVHLKAGAGRFDCDTDEVSEEVWALIAEAG